MKRSILLITLSICLLNIQAQIKWHNPQTEGAKIGGQALSNLSRTNYYQRLPDTVKSQVRDAVWGLSLNAAGQTLEFYTNSPRIVVRYTLAEGHAMPHMPATGKSGLDLYAYDENGREKWCAARYHFADTVTFRYEKLIYQNKMHDLGYEYRLSLPPYNTVKWLEIGVDSSATFRFIEPSIELPIIAYGTSITQGACASRPAMIWTDIVSRQLRTPLINLGFSGNGRLEKGILDVIKATPARAILLDCMPNLSNLPVDSIQKLLTAAIGEIRTTQPLVPILIVDHLGYPHSTMLDGWQQQVDNSILAQKTTYEKLHAAGDRNLYYLSHDQIGMPQDATVEAIHPSDYGMSIYGDAYVRKLREILNQPVGNLSSQIPVTQRREPGMYEWRERHQQLLRQVAEKAPQVVLFGNSITHYWGGTDRAEIQFGTDSWNQKITPLNAINMGCGWDRIENVLWRVYHGALDGYQAKKIIVAIGINNILYDRDSEVAEGMRMLISAIKTRQPQAEIVINGIYPARNLESRVAKANKELEQVAQENEVRFNNFGKLFLGQDGKINESYFRDGLHPNAEGYRLIVDQFIR